MYEHLVTSYGPLSPEDLITNRDSLSDPFDFSAGIEPFWTRLKQIQYVAEQGEQPIADFEIIARSLAVFQAAGMYGADIIAWDRKIYDPTSRPTVALFKQHFNIAARVHQIELDRQQLTPSTTTSGANGFQSAYNAPGPPPSPSYTAIATTPVTAYVPPPFEHYCWTHGLGDDASHTSATCIHPAKGHQVAACLYNRMRGSNIFRKSRHSRLDPHATTRTIIPRRGGRGGATGRGTGGHN